MGTQEEVSRPLRVVHDTNVVLSALLFRAGRLAWLREAWTEKRVLPLVSKETIAELVRVLGYAKFELDPEDAKQVLAHYLQHAETVQRTKYSGRLPSCRDPDDRVFLVLAHAARTDALVTADADLLELAARSRIPILAPEALRRRLA